MAIPKRLKETPRPDDTDSRHGGDAFFCLLMGIKEGQDAAIVTKNIIKAVQVPCVASVCELTVNTSIGISIYLRDGATVKALIKSAHAAMYRAKQNKSGYSFRAALHRSQPEQSVLVGDLVNEMSRPATMLCSP